MTYRYSLRSSLYTLSFLGGETWSQLNMGFRICQQESV